MLGPPGSGKGTQAVVLAKSLGVPHVSTGEIFRDHKARRTDLGLQVEAIMARGDLVPDSIVNAIVQERLGQKDCRSRGFILDGYPRTVAQAEVLGSWLAGQGMPLEHVVELAVPEDLLVQRLGGRRKCSGCGKDVNVAFQPPKVAERCDECGGDLITRADDRPEAIRRRLEIDAEQAKPLSVFYAGQGLVRTVNGARGVEEITREILGKLGRA